MWDSEQSKVFLLCKFGDLRDHACWYPVDRVCVGGGCPGTHLQVYKRHGGPFPSVSLVTVKKKKNSSTVKVGDGLDSLTTLPSLTW